MAAGSCDADSVTVVRVEAGLGILGLLVLGLVIVASVASPYIAGDSWAYHLPFSARLWSIDGGMSAFVLSNEMEQRFVGFPLFAEFLQGALWKLSGSLKAVTLINSLSLLTFIVIACRSSNVSLPLLTFATLSVPHVALHALSSYIDLFVGLCVGFHTLAAERVAIGATRNEGRWAVAYVATAAAAGNSKVTGLFMSAAVSAFVLGYLVWRRKALSPRRQRRIALLTLVASLTAGGTMLKNTFVHANPVYPTTVSMFGASLAGPQHPYIEYPSYTEALGPIARPVNWLLSVTEIDWKIRGLANPYTPDSFDAGNTPAFRHARTGGFWGSLVIGTLVLAFVLALVAARRRSRLLDRHAFFLCLFAFLTLVGSCLPQSHELRYQLHWPVLLMVALGILIEAAEVGGKTRIALTLVYLGALIASQQMVAYPIRAWHFVSQETIVAFQSSPSEIEFARYAGGVCLGPEYNPRQFAYASLFHGGVYGVEQAWSEGPLACTRFPRYVSQNRR